MSHISRGVTRNGVDDGPLPQMPFLIQQANLLNVGIVGGFLFVMLTLATAGFPRAWPVLLSISVAFWPVAAGFALGPINPLGGYLLGLSRGWKAEMQSNSVRYRRLLAACYDPRSRRRAAGAIWVTSLMVVLMWWLSKLVLDHPLGNPLMSNELFAIVLTFGLTLTVWIGMFGATVRIRRQWREIMTTGWEWSPEIKYPGPLRDRISSFLSGKVSERLVRPS